MKIPYKQSANYDKNEEANHTNESPCLICGKEVNNPTLWVHLLTEGNLTSEEGDDQGKLKNEEDESQGFFPIGSACAKKLPKEFIFKSTLS